MDRQGIGRVGPSLTTDLEERSRCDRVHCRTIWEGVRCGRRRAVERLRDAITPVHRPGHDRPKGCRCFNPELEGVLTAFERIRRPIDPNAWLGRFDQHNNRVGVPGAVLVGCSRSNRVGTWRVVDVLSRLRITNFDRGATIAPVDVPMRDRVLTRIGARQTDRVHSVDVGLIGASDDEVRPHVVDGDVVRRSPSGRLLTARR